MISFFTPTYKIVLSRHAYIRANLRGVTADLIEATLKGGIQEKFGKNNIRFIKRYRRFTVICIGEIRSRQIKIITIETKP